MPVPNRVQWGWLGHTALSFVGGLLVSQVLTLFTTPVIYLAFDRIARRLRGPTREDDEASLADNPT